MSAFGSYIGHAQGQVRHQLPLHVKVPSLNVGRPPAVCRNINDSVTPILRFGGERTGIRENTCHSVVNLRWAAICDVHGLPVEESQTILIEEGSFLSGFVEDPVAAAENAR